MKKFMDAVKEPSQIEKTDAKDMHQFLSIVTEGKNTTTNRLSMAEQMAVQQYTPETKKNITNPVLNVSKDAKPSMIGKYFKAVEEEIAEAQERTKDRAKLIAERVISKMHSASKQRIEEYYNVPATDSKSPIPGHVSGCQCKEVEEGLKDPKDNPCWKGYKPVGTKKKGGRTVPNCVPKEGVTEGSGEGNLYAMALRKYPQLKRVDRETVINALNGAYEDYLMHYGYEGIGPDEESSMIDYVVKGLKQGVAKGSEQKPSITYKDYTLQYDYQTEDTDPEGYSTATTYYFDVLKDGNRVGDAEYFDYFGDLTIRINGKTKKFEHRHPLASQVSELVSSLPDNQKRDLSDPKVESQGMAEGGPKGYDSDGNPLGGGYDEYENNWVVTIDGKTWKTFDDERQAYKAAAAIERKYGKKTRVYKN